ncbi:MAG: restriction endonuclease subunit S [Terrisporobacter othiniensis]|uniref:Restriction endonuclease subunit S n=1 Tax=Terrisporobacter muris TaxID=2963284 RepID=A0A9X2MJF9_9FIRM|nr:restriction endonuclease subunit S [Terrisporobacter othiniensis]MCR1825081.1 restriction endonuclease subunit S [Terrisporobacter muris]MDY3372603.1 restriction endonuclease subunit S [Terrisporobacter othiniensis]
MYNSEEYITDERIENGYTKLILKDTVLVAMCGQGLMRGRASILRKECVTNQAVCLLVPSEKINCEFLYYYFMKNYCKFRQSAKGVNKENLRGKVIGQLKIELPLIKEQVEVVRILKRVLGEENIINEVIDIEYMIENITKFILAKAFRGELGSNKLNEKSSVEVLQDILNIK